MESQSFLIDLSLVPRMSLGDSVLLDYLEANHTVLVSRFRRHSQEEKASTLEADRKCNSAEWPAWYVQATQKRQREFP